MKSRYSILIIVVFSIAISLYSCKGDVKSKNESIEESQKEVDDIPLAKNSLLDFYSYLNKEKYEECINCFSKHLRESLGDEILRQGLVQRQERIGETKNSEINYSFVETNTDSIKIYVFHTKCFSDEGAFHFENISFIKENDKFLIENYEYGNLPYVSVEEANDKTSTLNMYLTKMYEAINSDDFEKVYTFVDEEIIASLGKEKLKQGFELEIAPKFEITNFKVESVEAMFKETIPVVEMIISEIASEGVYRTSVMLVQRERGYTVGLIKDIPVIDVSVESDLLETENMLVMKYVNLFYDALNKEEFKNIVSYIDGDVFINNTKEEVLESFENRIKYFGLPSQFEVTKIEQENIGDRLAYRIDIIVQNESSKKCKESLVFVQIEDNKYNIYSYEYSELIQE